MAGEEDNGGGEMMRRGDVGGGEMPGTHPRSLLPRPGA